MEIKEGVIMRANTWNVSSTVANSWKMNFTVLI